MTRYSLEKTYAQPSFWAGAAAVRSEDDIFNEPEDELRAARTLSRVEQIGSKLTKGTPIGEIEEFRDWLGPRKPKG